MIEWGLAGRIARGLADAGGARLEPHERARRATLPGDHAAWAREAEEGIVAYTGLVPSAPLPAPEIVDRPTWVDANLGSMRHILDPVAERMGSGSGPLAGPTKLVGGLVLAAEVGGVAGILAQRVLGQYELVLLDPSGPSRLLLVAPNLHDAAARLDVELEPLVRWVGVHEVCHAVQFAGVPWLRGHLGGLLEQLLASVEVDVPLSALAKIPSREELETWARGLREEGLLFTVAGPERKALLDQVQACMAVVEGHAEHVMDAVGDDLLGSTAELRAALDRRRANQGPVWRVLSRLLGFDLKMRQYEDGKRFCDAVVERGGVEGLHRVFAAPAMVPSLDELRTPDAWLARTAV